MTNEDLASLIRSEIASLDGKLDSVAASLDWKTDSVAAGVRFHQPERSTRAASGAAPAAAPTPVRAHALDD